MVFNLRFLALAFLTSCLVSCSSIEQRDETRTLQSEMLRALNEQTPAFATCAKNHDLFEVFNQERVRVELLLNVNSKGQLDRFQIDKKPYPSQFVDCMFEAAEEANFPKLNKGETVQLTQPFIFTK